jgi:hypothetical protein
MPGLLNQQSVTCYIQGGHKLRSFRRMKAQFVTMGIILPTEEGVFSNENIRNL